MYNMIKIDYWYKADVILQKLEKRVRLKMNNLTNLRKLFSKKTSTKHESIVRTVSQTTYHSTILLVES